MQISEITEDPGPLDLPSPSPAPPRLRSQLLLRSVALGLLAALGGACVAIGAWQSAALSRAATLLTGGFEHPRSALAASALVAPIHLPPLPPARHGRSRTLARAAVNAAAELAGSGDLSVVGWNAQGGLWNRPYDPKGMPDNWQAPMWWQSAIALSTLVGYLQQTRDRQNGYQQLIASTYAQNIDKPGTGMPHNFSNRFADDTAWWAIAWADAARYELTVRHDTARAERYLAVAEADTADVYDRPRGCRQGIRWENGHPPDAIANEEFIALAARLAQLRSAPGRLHDSGRARMWLSEAQRTLSWLESSGLVDMATGEVSDHYDDACRPAGGAVTYTEGEMAEALVQVGRATNDPAYFNEAVTFLNRVLRPTVNMLGSGVLQQPCESQPDLCVTQGHAYDSAAYKGLLVTAMADWTAATGARTYAAFLLAQGNAVLANAASDGRARTRCETPHACQLGFYWARRVAVARPSIQDTTGTQESGLAALTAGLVGSSALSG